MIKKYWPFLLGGGIALWYFTKLKKASDAIKVNLANLKLSKGSGLSLPSLRMDFQIQNPTNTTVNVLGIVGDIYINGEYVANVSNLNKVQIPANGDIIYPVTVKASILDALPAILNLVKTRGQGQGLQVKASLNVNVDNILYPIDIDRKVI
jgi:LEA14-like dessication related protein